MGRSPGRFFGEAAKVSKCPLDSKCCSWPGWPPSSSATVPIWFEIFCGRALDFLDTLWTNEGGFDGN